VFRYIVSFSFVSDFEGAMPARYLRHGAQPEVVPEIKDMPQLQPYWAAGFSFSRGHFKVRVPYDAYQPMVFQVFSLRFF
jgi:[Skp1-protein]-hydroxyproline N-acetylglucosaminyltransferase